MGCCFGVEGSDAKIVAHLAQEDCLILDANPEKKYQAGHIAGAHFADVKGPMNSKAADAAVKKLQDDGVLGDNKNVPIVCHCTLGGEANSAKKALIRAGYTNVLNGKSKARVEKLMKKNTI